ncbi:MAG: hypothetical protein CME32_01140 [Gimesia sp.]|nr:hypothetical protein [Gimesia sp.]
MVVTNYLWDVDSYVEEYDELGATKTAYTNEPTEFGKIVSQHRDTTTSFYHFDAQGSTHQLTDQNENVTDTFLYDAWGNEILRNGTVFTPFRFLGEFGYFFEEDLETYYVRARIYQPTIARWLSYDPLNFADGVNLYLYLANNSVNGSDPSGMSIFFEDPSEGPQKIPEPPIPFPEFPIIPTPDTPQLPLDKCLPCNFFKPEDWFEELCNPTGRPSLNPRQKNCPCKKLPGALTPLTDEEIKTLFQKSLGQAGLSGSCSVDLIIRDTCSTSPDRNAGNFAVTCVNPESHTGPHKICIPRTVNQNEAFPPRCFLGGLMGHELIHVDQICSVKTEELDCFSLETEAYTHNCTDKINRLCLKPEKRGPAIDRCVRQGRNASCDPKNKAGFGNFCETVF